MPLVEVSDLTVSFGGAKAVRHVSLAVDAGEIVGIAGESGSGKTTLCSAIARSLPRGATVTGEIVFDGRSLDKLSPSELRRIRGREISMVLQNPMTSLDPLFTIGDQFGEVLSTRAGVPRVQIRGRAAELLSAVHLTAPETRLRQYPHELSGGMRQRVLIAMASATSPKLLLADEPTTALDATVQEEILILFQEIRQQHGTAIVIVTHDLGIIRRVCDRVAIMYAGRIVEEGPVEAIFTAPKHPYTQALLASVPTLDGSEVKLRSIPGQVPGLHELGDFCAFAERCPAAVPQCRKAEPVETPVGPRHRAFCWLAG
jgi:oligopeptide/dipeptide ABC transporter ATP-binding protein